MKLKRFGILLLVTLICILPGACDTDRYANQSTVTVTEPSEPELRKALISKLNSVNFDYEITKDGDIRYPKKNQSEFDAILAQVAQEARAPQN